MLSSSFLFNVDLVLIDAFVRRPIDSLERANRVLGRRKFQNHVFTKLSNRNLEARLFSSSTVLERILLALLCFFAFRLYH